MTDEPRMIGAEAEPVAWDALPDQARVIAITETQIDVVADPFDGFLYGIRPGEAAFVAVRYPLEEQP